MEGERTGENVEFCHLWRQKLWCCLPTNLEQSAAQPKDTWHQLQTF